MEIEPVRIAEIAAAFSSLGASFAFARPFAVRFFESWLTRAEQREADERDKSRAIVRIAETHERTVGLLEIFSERLDRVDARLDRIEAHHGISPSPSAIPSEPPPVAPRRQLTDPAIERTAPGSAQPVRRSE